MSLLVSIVLPTYNGSKYLQKSIESCLAQTYTNIELIIVDDCSTDNSAGVIREFMEKDNRVFYIRNEVNQKLPRSLNTGFERAKGKYYTWTSDDNYYAPVAIAEMVEILEEKNEIGLVYCDYTIINEEGKQEGIKKFGDVNKNMVSWLGCGACFLYKAELHTQLKGYDPSAFLIEDYDFFIRALTITRFYYLERSDLYYYRYHPASLTSLYGFYNFDLQKIVVERQLPQLTAVASQKDRALWYRKFAVYYGVSKNNSDRMNYYLKKLFSESKTQSVITVFYIIYKKMVTGIRISALAFVKLLILPFQKTKN